MTCGPGSHIFTLWWSDALTYMVWPGELGMLEPGLEHILSDDEHVGCGTSTGLEPTTYVQHKQ